MTRLRRRMIEDLRIRGLSQYTIDTYIGAVERFARYFGRSPTQLGKEEVRAFQVHLTCERHVSSGTLNVYVSALRFLYTITLGKDWEMRGHPLRQDTQEAAHGSDPGRSAARRSEHASVFMAGSETWLRIARRRCQRYRHWLSRVLPPAAGARAANIGPTTGATKRRK